MSLENATRIYNKIESDGLAQKLIAESNARYILHYIKEPLETFQSFTINLDDRLSTIAFTYISAGCQYAENNNYQLALDPLEKGANLLRNIHSPSENKREYSKYFVLVSSLAYYACGQYSKSFILLKELEFDSDTAKLISFFLKKDFTSLIEVVNYILLTEYIRVEANSNIEEDVYQKIYTSLLAKSFNTLIEYIFTGNEDWLTNSIAILDDLEELLRIDNEPSMWWAIRLLRIIFKDFKENSLWSLLPPFIDNNSLRLNDFILSLAFRKSPVFELFYSQKLSLPILLNAENKGAIISLPTSSGKTRIAELGIFHSLNNNPGSKVIYIAPYRSLAYEVEETFDLTFDTLNYKVTHLYGGAQYSRIDISLIEESDIIIGTPEKIKAIFRANPEIIEAVKLIIIDEGHLLGAKERFIRNELLIEEFKSHMNANGGRILLLSAVLPNSAEISHWLTGEKHNAVTSTWRPAEERLGIIEWTGKEVNINWHGSHESSNINFIPQEEVLRGKKVYHYPNNKIDAIASVAVKLSSFGSVLLFVSLKNSVFTYAKAVLEAMGSKVEPFQWKNEFDWEAFTMACDEAYGEDSKILRFATFGILCHNADLSSEVRMIMERLMRSDCPPIIIATSTLGQGVNIGVSTVIFTTNWVNQKPLEQREFWNIAGRSGRAYADHEGKILLCLDRTKEEWQVKRDLKDFKKYFNKYKNEDAESGLYIIINNIKIIANNCGIDFDLLLQLIAENNFSNFILPTGENFASKIEYDLDLIDDSLLALNLRFKSYELTDPSKWIDDFFRESLAIIQSEKSRTITPDELISLLKSRNKSILNQAGSFSRWKELVNSGLPFRSSLLIDEILPELFKVSGEYNNTLKLFENRVIFLESIEEILKKLPVVKEKISKFTDSQIDNVRSIWLQGMSISEISTYEKGQEICNDYYGFTLPWVINAISRRFKLNEQEEVARDFEEIALLIETGLPNILACKIYLAGIKSRKASIELSELIGPKLFEDNVTEIYIYLVLNIKEISELCSLNTSRWLELLRNNSKAKFRRIPHIERFTFKKLDIKSDVLLSRIYDDKVFLVSPDYDEKIEVSSSKEFPFDRLANNLGVQFNKVSKNGNTDWDIKIRNPHI